MKVEKQEVINLIFFVFKFYKGNEKIISREKNETIQFSKGRLNGSGYFGNVIRSGF